MKESVESVEFTPAKGGGMVGETRYKTKRSGQGGGPDFDYRHETTIHPNVKHAAAHLSKMFGTGEMESEKAGPEKGAKATA